MMVRPKTTKELAQRIDPLYVRHRSGMTWFRFSLSIGLVIAALGIWIYAGMRKHDTTLLLPGPVSPAHAMWQNDCAKCHVTEKGKLISRAAVSDEACLQCHYAPPHDRNQLLRAGPHLHSDLAFAVSDAPDKKTPTRSAACTACHDEHKGKDHLTAIDDNNCLRCHRNIATAAESVADLRTVNVDAFNDTGGHPFFGGALAQNPPLPRPTPNAVLPANALWDPMRLKFSHKRHLALSNFAPPAGMKQNCVLCHKPVQPSMAGDVQNRQAVQFTTQVDYNAQCQSCHPLKLSTGLPIPHIAMNLIENQLSDLDAMYKAWFATLKPDRRDEITEGDPAAWLAKDDGAKKPRIEADTWLRDQAKPQDITGATALAAELQTALKNKKDNASIGDVRTLPMFIAFGMGKSSAGTSCATCHEFKKNPSLAPTSQPSTTQPTAVTAVFRDAVASADPSAIAVPATAPSTQPAMPTLATEPTGLPDNRRWFVKSTFDHKPHQSWNCTECHNPSPTFDKTPDMLPNLTWVRENGTVTSCVVCHHATNKKEGRGARATCVTCHVYHDHSKPTVPAIMQPWPQSASAK